MTRIDKHVQVRLNLVVSPPPPRFLFEARPFPKSPDFWPGELSQELFRPEFYGGTQQVVEGKTLQRRH